VNRKLIVATAIVGLAALFLSGCGDGDTIVNAQPGAASGIQVTGVGRVVGAPDVVLLQLGVDVERPTVAEAREAAASAMQTVIDSMKRNGVADENIQTTQLTVTSALDQNRNVRGYRVSNVTTAKITKIDTASKVIDDATVAGGNSAVVRNIRFSIDDPTELQAEARKLAVEEARKRAEELAEHAGVSLGKPASITEEYQNVVPQSAGIVAAPRTGDASTPIQAGELEVVVSVNVLYTFE
jgi:uncharacterized protein YggE